MMKKINDSAIEVLLHFEFTVKKVEYNERKRYGNYNNGGAGAANA